MKVRSGVIAYDPDVAPVLSRVSPIMAITLDDPGEVVKRGKTTGNVHSLGSSTRQRTDQKQAQSTTAHNANELWITKYTQNAFPSSLVF